MGVAFTLENATFLTVRNALKRKLAAHSSGNVLFPSRKGAFLMKKVGSRMPKTGSAKKSQGLGQKNLG